MNAARFPVALFAVVAILAGSGCGGDSKPASVAVGAGTSTPTTGPTATAATTTQAAAQTAAASPTVAATAPPPTPTAAPAPPTPTSAPAPPASARVAVGGPANIFSPATVTIAAGGTVTWSWQSGFHDVTGDNFALKTDVQSTGTASFTFPAAGSYTFHCSVHPDTMQGTVIVR